jgi:hypothetical protein
MNEPQVVNPHTEILPAQIERLDNRLKQIEKIAETVESITEKGLEAATKYFESKAELERQDAETADAQHKREIELQDKKHQRSVIVLSIITTLVFILVFAAMYMGQYELVKIILGSSLAVAGGAGLANLFKGSGK